MATRLTAVAVVVTTVMTAHSADSARAICFEAELANRLEPAMEIHQDRRCSGGRAVLIRQGAGAGQSSTGTNGVALYAVEIPLTGRYDVWLRACWLDECSNSISLISPDGTLCTVMDHTFGDWHWVRGTGVYLETGVQIFMLRNREDGVGIDQLLILPAGQQPPRGKLAPTVVPGETALPEGCHSLAWAVTAVPAKLPGKPPRRYDVRHSLGGTGDGAAYPPMACAIPGNRVTLDLWLRNNAGTPVEGRVGIKDIVGIRLQTPPELGATVPAHGLSQLSFDVIPEDDLPIGEHPIRFHIRTGKQLRRARTRLIRPLEWQFAGPFTHQVDSTIDAPHPPEIEGHRQEAYRVGKRTITWKTYALSKTYSPFGFVDLVRLFGDVRWKACYARSQIEVREDGECQLILMGDDMVRVWVDGVCRATADAALPATLNRRITRVTLGKGLHDVVVKSCQARNYWEFFVSFAPLAGHSPTVFGVPLKKQNWHAE